MSIDMPATPRAPKTPAMMASTKNPIAKLSKPAIFYTLLNTEITYTIGRSGHLQSYIEDGGTDPG